MIGKLTCIYTGYEIQISEVTRHSAGAIAGYDTNGSKFFGLLTNWDCVFHL